MAVKEDGFVLSGLLRVYIPPENLANLVNFLLLLGADTHTPPLKPWKWWKCPKGWQSPTATGCRLPSREFRVGNWQPWR
jgi:hypothetical protein